ncbi:MAG TPA: transcriptional regulator NrdR [Polyangia bacterium]|nr:transcriptional regulator NrdR [Polyangia bacterium]
MKCGVCGAADTRVIDSRVIRDGSEIRRRRHCDSCSHRFTTYERVEELLPAVVKKDGRREPWNREKIMRGLSKACEKRPVPVSQVERLADEVGRMLAATGEPEVPSARIGEQIMAALRDIDEVAFVRFASVYRSFKGLDEFVSEVSEVIGRREAREPAADPEAGEPCASVTASQDRDDGA